MHDGDEQSGTEKKIPEKLKERNPHTANHHKELE